MYTTGATIITIIIVVIIDDIIESAIADTIGSVDIITGIGTISGFGILGVICICIPGINKKIR